MEDIIDDCTNGASDDEDGFDCLKLSSAKVLLKNIKRIVSVEHQKAVLVLSTPNLK